MNVLSGVAAMPTKFPRLHSSYHVTTSMVLLFLFFCVSVCSVTPILLCSIHFDAAEIKDTAIYYCYSVFHSFDWFYAL